MTDDALNSAAPETLARLLQAEDAPAWSAQNAAAVIAHQLAAPLLPDLLDFPGAEPKRTEALVRITPGLFSFAHLLAHPHPPLELLNALRLFARHHRDNTSSPIHGDPATVLYFAAIAAALATSGKRISQLDDEALRQAFRWCRDYPAAPALQPLFTAAKALVELR